MKQKIKLVQTADGVNYLVPFVLITTLFFLWGFAHSILDVLNKHFQDALSISKTHSALIQAVVYGGYFLMAMPAGEIIRRYGYRAGVVTGLLLYGIGALMFIPGERIMSFEFFLLSLFIIGCGLTCLETAANPYVTVLGEKESAERRINLAQSFNGLGWICGPLVGGLFLFSADGGSGNIAIPYAIIGILVLLVAIVFSRIHLPEISIPEEPVSTTTTNKSTSLWKHRNFTFGLIALFFYVAAQTGINSFFINYVTEHINISAREAALWLSFVGMGLFMAGRMAGSWIMGFIRAEKLLAFVAAGAILAMILVMMGLGHISSGAFFFCFLCESIMFPTIFALAIRGVGEHTKRASSYLIMSIVGGAIAPVIMGYIADTISTATGFIVPLLCFIVILAYAIDLRKK
ncbi:MULTISPECIES: sugar MFS transporter [unclassified Phocaeicola]|jgi:FHS family L-fucose permease-like MFS transporter|uniref:sugar MFS transporter n=1 Tax=unclassified Phocaeicola TaxID=2762211 RepID=UPI000335BD3D|nr:l-fucose:H+ symporter permease [Bacteroides sp. CAG:1076]